MPTTATLAPLRADAGIRAAPADTAGIDGALALGMQLLARVESFAAALGELGDIELPEHENSRADQASLEAVAPLYLAAELEDAGLLPAVELLAGVFASGGLNLEAGPAGARLAKFWRGRRERFSPAERGAFFTRLFGGEAGPGLAGEGGANRDFTLLMIDLTEAVYQWEGHPLWPETQGAAEETRVRMAARQLAANLLPRSAGMTLFAARDILTAVKDALDILKEPAVQAHFGTRSVWGAVDRIFQRYRGDVPAIAGHLERAKAGQRVLAWLAGALPHLSAYATPILASGHEVIAAAAAWMQATLAIEEQRNPAPTGHPRR